MNSWYKQHDRVNVCSRHIHICCIDFNINKTNVWWFTHCIYFRKSKINVLASFINKTFKHPSFAVLYSCRSMIFMLHYYFIMLYFKIIELCQYLFVLNNPKAKLYISEVCFRLCIDFNICLHTVKLYRVFEQQMFNQLTNSLGCISDPVFLNWFLMIINITAINPRFNL